MFPRAAFQTGSGATAGYTTHIKIADGLGVSIDYLVRGIEINQDSLSAREVELLTCFRKMSDRRQKVIEKRQ